MKILFTGGSSFSGMWFVKELAKAGHQVTGIFQRPLEHYEGTRRARIDQILPLITPVFDCTFGDDLFLKLIEQENWDLLCHHAADVTNYKSPDFDPIKAVSNNTKNLTHVIPALQKQGCRQILLTGSVFEQGEGAGTDHLRAVSPYGLSKGLTSAYFDFYTDIHGMKLKKFVIPNPYGPYEEPRFTSFLALEWFSGKVAPVTQPDYVRDNIPISLLAKAYVQFAEKLSDGHRFEKFNPSFRPESQGEFTLRLAKEMEKRLKIPCGVELKKQTAFPEPKIRINTDPLDIAKLGWNESEALDELAAYYSASFHHV
jgi:nucleoside-diphosphate-sugar epimerase